MAIQKSKWIDCYEISSTGKQVYHKASFVDNQLMAASGQERPIPPPFPGRDENRHAVRVSLKHHGFKAV